MSFLGSSHQGRLLLGVMALPANRGAPGRNGDGEARDGSERLWKRLGKREVAQTTRGRPWKIFFTACCRRHVRKMANLPIAIEPQLYISNVKLWGR